jgi:hypothetical protein
MMFGTHFDVLPSDFIADGAVISVFGQITDNAVEIELEIGCGCGGMRNQGAH